jgi:hypothetical protein
VPTPTHARPIVSDEPIHATISAHLPLASALPPSHAAAATGAETGADTTYPLHAAHADVHPHIEAPTPEVLYETCGVAPLGLGAELDHQLPNLAQMAPVPPQPQPQPAVPVSAPAL